MGEEDGSWWVRGGCVVWAVDVETEEREVAVWVWVGVGWV